jgi:hypothetical protein
MYVLAKGDFVFAGPNIWHTRLFESYIEDDYEMIIKLPLDPPTQKTDIGHGIFAYPVVQTQVPYNPKIEYLHGPFYNFTDEYAEQYHEPLFKNIDIIKNELKVIVANNRYNKEISGTNITIQDHNIILDTNRGSRDIYLQALNVNADSTAWKLNSDIGVIWLTLSIEELTSIVNSIRNHVQSCFDWEMNKSIEIDACLTPELLNEVELEWPINQIV